MSAPHAVAPRSLSQSLLRFPPPAVVDVRRAQSFGLDPNVIAGAIHRAPDELDAWTERAEPWRAVVVYCAHGLDVGRDAA